VRLAHIEAGGRVAISCPPEEDVMDSWPLVIGFSAVAAAVFAYGFLIAG